jgi:hypothetical protein
MVDSFRAGVVSSSRGRRGGPGLRVEELPELAEGVEGKMRLRGLAKDAAGQGIEHPGRDRESGAVGRADDETISAASPETAQDVDLLVVQRMMLVANARRGC